MKKLIAYCGYNCEKCDVRIATVNNDNSLREKSAKLWTDISKTYIMPDMINCTGCRTSGVKLPFCNDECEIRKCAINKGVDTCMSCDDMKKCKIISKIYIKNL